MSIEHGAQNFRSDAGGSDRVKEMQVATQNALVFDITLDNTKTTAADCWVQLWDVDDAANIGQTGFPTRPEHEDFLGAGQFLPYSWSKGKQFWNGLLARCVTGPAATALIASADVKISGRMHSPYPIAS